MIFNLLTNKVSLADVYLCSVARNFCHESERSVREKSDIYFILLSLSLPRIIWLNGAGIWSRNAGIVLLCILHPLRYPKHIDPLLAMIPREEHGHEIIFFIKRENLPRIMVPAISRRRYNASGIYFILDVLSAYTDTYQVLVDDDNEFLSHSYTCMHKIRERKFGGQKA